MNWNHVEGNWTVIRGSVKAHWDKLSDDHLDSIAGQRDQLLGQIEENYGVGRDEAERQVKDWEERHHGVFAETAAAIEKLPKHLHGATE